MELSHLYPNLYARNMSFIRARDPSIIHGNLNNVRRYLDDEYSNQTYVVPTILEEDCLLKVFLRIKKDEDFSNQYNIEQDNLLFKIQQPSTASSEENYKVEKYTFSKIFNMNSTQEELFNNTIKEKMLGFINGHNSTIMAYGASGSGKTFTLFGTETEPGIIPRTLKYLFDSLPDLNHYPHAAPLPTGKIQLLDNNGKLAAKHGFEMIYKNIKSYKEIANVFSKMEEKLNGEPLATVENVPPILAIWVSMIEIHNEQIHDLLDYMPFGQETSRINLKLAGCHDNVYIKDAKNIYVKSSIEAYSVLQYGFQNQKRASTKINHDSSRSHCIFTIRLLQGYNEENSMISTFNFCDLAGSEKLKKTLHVGARLKEANSINNSLLVLGRCINMLRKFQRKHEIGIMPVRDSKLTQLLQKPLSGKEDIQMIVNISPSNSMFNETHSTLNFAAIAKEIKIENNSPVKMLKQNSRFSAYLQNDKSTDNDSNETEQQLRDEIAELTLQLSDLQNGVATQINREREHLIETYGRIISIKNSQIEELEREVKWLKRKEQRQREREQKQRELEEQEAECIVIDDDSDTNDVEASSERTTERLSIETCKTSSINEAQMELLRKENNNLKQEVNELKQQVIELKKTLEDATDDFNSLEKQVEVLNTNNLMLEDQIETQNVELEELRTFRRLEIEDLNLKEGDSDIY